MLSFDPLCALQEHPDPLRKRKQLNRLTEKMLAGTPFPRLHAKAAETKALIQPVHDALLHFQDQDRTKLPLIRSMLHLLECSNSIDVLISGVDGFKCSPAEGARLRELVFEMNVTMTKLCHIFHNQHALFLFNFVPKNHYMFHLAELGQHMSPKLAWCYQGEDLMCKIKTLAQGSFRGTPPKKLGNKILGKYLVGLAQALSRC